MLERHVRFPVVRRQRSTSPDGEHLREADAGGGLPIQRSPHLQQAPIDHRDEA